MNKDVFKKWDFGSVISVIGIALIVLAVVLVVFFRSPANEEASMGYGGIPESIVAYATASTGEAIYMGAVFLDRMIVGLDESDATVSLIDAVTDSSSATVFFDIRGDTLQGVYEIGARLHEGIFYTTSGSINATFIFRPM